MCVCVGGGGGGGGWGGWGGGGGGGERSMLLKEKSAWGLEVQTASDKKLGGSLGM